MAEIAVNHRKFAFWRLAPEMPNWLGEVTGLPVVFFDESFTTHDAEQHLLAAGLTSKKRKARRDRVAAQIMLQAYLEAER